jgi:hypothetical protein
MPRAGEAPLYEPGARMFAAPVSPAMLRIFEARSAVPGSTAIPTEGGQSG